MSAKINNFNKVAESKNKVISSIVYNPYHLIAFYMKKNILFFALAALFLSLLAASCNNTSNANQENAAISIGTFTEFPEDVIGCSSYVSNDTAQFQNREYIYVSDLNSVAYMKINDELLRFELQDSSQTGETTSTSVYANDKYEITFDQVDGEQSGYETVYISGSITITDKTNETKSAKAFFFGEFGC